MNARPAVLLLALAGLEARGVENGNPLVTHMFTADPSAHVYEGRVYVYGSHDKDNSSGYNMEDYHVLSSEDLVNWVDHGLALHVDDVPWAESRMWAPDCAYRDGTYYFYFPARDASGGKYIGVATSDSPSGPFVPEPAPIEGTNEIDPCVFTDDDGQVYLYWGGHAAKAAKLDETMKQLDGDVVELEGADYFYEAAWMHKRNGVYYLSYSDGDNYPGTSGHVIVYATSDSPLGPFEFQGVVNGDVVGVTNHHSIVEYKGQWYLFYHNAELSGGISTRRSVVADYLHYNDDGTIREVVQTKLGIGQYDGGSRIEAENYTETGNAEQRENDEGGLHVRFDPGDELVFTNVHFEEMRTETLRLRVACGSGAGSVEVRDSEGGLLAAVAIPDTGGSQNWRTVTAPVPEMDDVATVSIFYQNADAVPLELDWFEFGGEFSEPLNLAPQGSATQSSTDYGGEASRAIDGNTDGDWAGGSVTHTEEEDQPWWRLDLGETCEISEIRIWGRTLSNESRLSDYDVSVIDLYGQTVWSSYQEDHPDPVVSLDTGSVSGRHVMIQLRGTEALSLAEVEVFGVVLDEPVGLLAEWKMDETGGAEVLDSSGWNHDAVVSGCVRADGVEGNCLEFDGGSSTVSLPVAPFAFIHDQITISMWVHGDTTQARKDSVFGAVDGSGNRVLNIHLPWSNSNVYWDAGNSGGTGFDRIQKTATAHEFKGRWNHWVFTKDANAGSMRIYLNGVLWHSPAIDDDYETMGGIASAAFGSGVGADNYDGMIDEVRLYNVALSGDEVGELYENYGGIHAWLSGFHDLDDPSLAGDPDHDGIPTLLEYVLNGDPTVSDPEILPVFESMEEGAVFRFGRLADSTGDTDQVFQYSSDLRSWVDVPLTGEVGPEVGIGPASGETEDVTITIGGAAPCDELFGRIEVFAE